jgi:long-chain acyl-CoA synthetase
MTNLTDLLRFNRTMFRDQVFTKEHLAPAIDRCARYLDNNIRSNSPIVYLVAPNHIKTIVAFIAIVRTGRAALLVDPKTGKLEYGEMLADTMPSAIITIDPQTMELDYGREIAFTDNRMDPALSAQLEDVCVMLYTAADDGYAKAAMLTHWNMLSNARAISRENQVAENSTVCALLPFHHLYGFQNGIVLPLTTGGSCAVCDLSDMTKANVLADEIVRRKVSHVYSVPLLFYLLSKSPRIGEIGRQVHLLMSGGYKLPAPLLERYERKLNIPLYEGYGLTEASPVCTCQNPLRQDDRASIGRPMADYRVRIVDDAGTELPSGRKGEIWFRGGNVMKGYFNRPDATKEKIVNGWLRTGDYGRQDRDGNVFFMGLKKKMFNIAGNKVYPEHVKRLLLKNRNVQGLWLSSVYNEMTGDRMEAKAGLSDASPEAITGFREWCARSLGSHKIPQFSFFPTQPISSGLQGDDPEIQAEEMPEFEKSLRNP